MASGNSSPILESLSCSVCCKGFNTTINSPKALPCLHTFCSSCIQRLIDQASNAFEVTFKCPVCRSEVASSDVRTNLALQNTVEDLMEKQRAKEFCSEHPAKECHMICVDCYQPICSLCIKGLINGPHRDHTIDDMEDAKAEFKKRLNTVLKDKIKALEKKTTAEVNKLKQQSEKYARNVDTVVYMVTEAVQAWRDEQLQDETQQTQAAIDKLMALCKSQKETLTKKCNLTNSKHLIEAYREIEKGSRPAITNGIV